MSMCGGKTSEQESASSAAYNPDLHALCYTHREAVSLFVMAARQGATDVEIAAALRQGLPHFDKRPAPMSFWEQLQIDLSKAVLSPRGKSSRSPPPTISPRRSPPPPHPTGGNPTCANTQQVRAKLPSGGVIRRAPPRLQEPKPVSLVSPHALHQPVQTVQKGQEYLRGGLFQPQVQYQTTPGHSTESFLFTSSQAIATEEVSLSLSLASSRSRSRYLFLFFALSFSLSLSFSPSLSLPSSLPHQLMRNKWSRPRRAKIAVEKPPRSRRIRRGKRHSMR